MILKGNERGYGAELARHLLNPRDNDHVTIHSIEGFVSSDLTEAFAECEAISQGTQCQKYLFSLSLNPPPGANVQVEAFEDAIAQIERKLGLSGQPRAIVFHEKQGRRHAHCVWSRIDASRMRAINLPHSKRKLMDITQELYLLHGWAMPDGIRDYSLRDALSYSGSQAAQAKHSGQDPTALKTFFAACWAQSDSRAGFAAALWAKGYCLARGDQRGFVAVDAAGKVWSLSRWCGIKPAQLAARLGDPGGLPSTEEALRLLVDGATTTSQMAMAVKSARLEERKTRLIDNQRQERAALLVMQERRRAKEILDRKASLPVGLKAAWARLNGSYQRLIAEAARLSGESDLRDRKERQTLIEQHLAARRELERQLSVPDLSSALENVFADALRVDTRQHLKLQPEELPFTRDQLAADPVRILAHLSQKEAQFSENKIKRALAAFIDDPLALRMAIDVVMTAPELVRTKSGTSFTTRAYLTAEQTLDQEAVAMAEQGGFAVSRHHVTRAMLEQNEKLANRFGSHLSEEQCAAVEHVLGETQLSCVVGLAGAGKSTMLETARIAWTRQGLRVHGASLSGKAAEGLQSASGIESRTLASLETSWKNGYEPIAGGDILVIDEAGMIGTRQLMRVATKIHQIGAKLVLVGDPDQLQPIEAGQPFRRLIDKHGAVRLSEIHRQRETWQRHASRDLAEGRIEAAVNAYDAEGRVRRGAQRDMAVAALVEDYLKDRETSSSEISQLVFAHRRVDVFALNQAIRSAIRETEDTPPEVLFQTETGPRAFAPGERIVFTRNDKDIGVRNGVLGTVEALGPDQITVRLDGSDGKARRVTFAPQQYGSFDHGYAVTIHKSQGATVDHAYVLASRTMDATLAYVAMTRHREALGLYVDEQDMPAWMNSRGTEQQPRPRRRRVGPTLSK